MNPVFHGTIGSDGRLHLTPPYDVRWSTHLKSFKAGAEVSVVVKKTTKKVQRSEAQNRYYFGVVIKMMAADLGYEPEDLHEALKVRFLSKKLNNELSVVGSTAALSTAEFAEFVDDVRRFAASYLNLFIPDPGDVDVDGAEFSFSE